MQDEFSEVSSMSMELIDARIKITELTDAVLDVEASMSGRDRSEIMRTWLHEISVRKQSEAILLCKTLTSKGLIKA